MTPTLLLDLEVLGCHPARDPNASLEGNRPSIVRFQQVLTGFPTLSVVITSRHKVHWRHEEIAARVFDHEFYERVVDCNQYAWIRVPFIEEQELSMYVLSNPKRAPFIVVGPVGPPACITGRDVYWLRCERFGEYEARDLEKMCYELTVASVR